MNYIIIFDCGYNLEFFSCIFQQVYADYYHWGINQSVKGKKIRVDYSISDIIVADKSIINEVKKINERRITKIFKKERIKK